MISKRTRPLYGAFVLLGLLALGSPGTVAAQETVQGELATMEEEPPGLDISGYIQAEYRDREGDDEFRVRRGRVKFTYQGSEQVAFVLQGDFSSSGVSLKDAYIELSESTTGWGNTLTAGQFKWPFGFEVLYSSSRREVPERSRIVRALFPGERDRGVMLSGEMPDGTIDYRVGVFNGNGTSDASDDDSVKDLVGRVGFSVGPVSGGVSGYSGEEMIGGVAFDKTRSGFDLQWETPVPGLGLRGEFISGEDAGRDVEGWYTYLIYEPLERHMLAIRLDEIDDSFETTTTVTAAYTYEVLPGAIAMFAWEHPDGGGRDTTTVRLQYKF